MPELAEIAIMRDFINDVSSTNSYTQAFKAENCKVKTDLEVLPGLFNLQASSRGKELMLTFPQMKEKLVFTMGMSGTWVYARRDSPNMQALMRNARIWFATPSGSVLILYDPRRFAKWSWQTGFSEKRGPDPVTEHELFKNRIYLNYGHKDFDEPICSLMMNQKYFNGIGNYLRSTILYQTDINPFQSLNNLLESTSNFHFFDYCKTIPEYMFKNGGGQLMDWVNPFGKESTIDEIVFYQQGLACIDDSKRTFWFDKKWLDYCPFDLKEPKIRKKKK